MQEIIGPVADSSDSDCLRIKNIKTHIKWLITILFRKSNNVEYEIVPFVVKRNHAVVTVDPQIQKVTAPVQSVIEG